MAEVRLEGVSRIFPGGAVGVREVELTAEDSELLVLVGPSGSGKSTLLRIVAGLEEPTAGRVWIGGKDVTALPPQRRNVAMVFQSYALYPHKSVRENLAFGLRARGTPGEEIAARVADVAEALGIGPLLDRRPAQLSGGQRQRVALGRAIVREPHAFLLDEPLSNLDPALRIETRAELARLQRRIEATMLYVTHDQEEAMTLGHRVAVVNDGRILQIAPPMTLYREPANLFVAGFLGSPPMNLIRGAAREDGGFEAAGVELARVRPPGRAGEPLVLGVRPHEVRCASGGEGDGPEALVELVEPLGSQTILHLALVGGDAAGPLTAVVTPEGAPAHGERVRIHLPEERLHWFDGRGERIRAPV